MTWLSPSWKSHVTAMLSSSSNTRSSDNRLPVWMLTWFYLTSVVCIWDASYVMFRPHSLPGGELSRFWPGYESYVVLDQRYVDMEDDYVFAQSLLNYVEVIINIVVIGMDSWHSAHIHLTAFTVSVMTLWKTVLYFLMFTDLCTGGAYRQGNNSIEELYLMFIPNAVWLVMPCAVIFCLWPKLVPATGSAPHDTDGDKGLKMAGSPDERTLSGVPRDNQEFLKGDLDACCSHCGIALDDGHKAPVWSQRPVKT